VAVCWPGCTGRSGEREHPTRRRKAPPIRVHLPNCELTLILPI